MTHYDKRADIRAALQRNTSRTCAIPSCGFQRAKLSRYCATHGKREQQTGDPCGRIYRASFWRPYVAAADRFLTLNADHTEVLAAQGWCQREIDEAAHTSGTRSWDACARILATARENGRTGRDFLVIVLAAFAAYTDDPYAFSSPRMLRFNLARQFARLAGYGHMTGATGHRLGVRAMEYVAGRLITALGAVATKAAKAMAPALAGMPGTPPPTPKAVSLGLSIPINHQPI